MRTLPILLAAFLFGSFQIGRVAEAAVPARSVKPTQTFTVGMLRVEHFGTTSGTPIIFIPALFCGSWQWNGQIAALAPNHEIYVVTLPGFDGRPRDNGPALMDRAAASLAQLIRERHLVRPIVIGHSLGGTLAVFFAEQFPSAAGGIIAVEGGYPSAPTAAARKQTVDASAAPYVGADPATFDRVLRTTMLRYTITSKSDVDTVARQAERSDPTAIALWMRAALELDLTPKLSAIRVPLTEIVPFDPTIDPYRGMASLAAKQRAYQTWLDHARDGSVIMIDNSRHFVMFDQPPAFDRVLFARIAQLSSPQQ
jgi:pimeloyl-ACP methyl ester carboxylesterase